jgi:hypothetical protein
LWNMFLTHPEVCSPIWETLQIFSLNPRAPRWEGVKVAILSHQLRLFDQWQFVPRRPISDVAKMYIDQVLYDWKLKTFTDEDMKYKYEGEVYDLTEVQNARLVIKNNNGLTYLSDLFLEMYPGATFIGLVRHPVALYESHKRRGTPVSKMVVKFGAYYHMMANKMVSDANTFPNYHIVKFEDLLGDPIASIRQLYNWSGLDFAKLKKIRFKAKPHYQVEGKHHSSYQVGRHYWFDFDSVYEILEPKVNEFQMNQLDEDEKKGVLKVTAKTRALLGYNS